MCDIPVLQEIKSDASESRVQALNLFLNLHGNYVLNKYGRDHVPFSIIFYHKMKLLLMVNRIPSVRLLKDSVRQVII